MQSLTDFDFAYALFEFAYNNENQKNQEINMSIWEKNEKPSFPKLSESINTDVAVIGGGMAGVLTAYELTKRNIDCLLLEKGEIGGGVTKNTTAKVTAQHNLIYENITRKYGTEYAKKYLRANLDAVEMYRRLCKKLNCRFENRDSYVYTRNDPAAIEAESRALSNLGFEPFVTSETDLPFKVLSAIKFENQGQIDPLEFIYAVAKQIKAYEHSEATVVSPERVEANGATVSCKMIVVATHFPFINKYGMYFAKMYQQRSYVLALENAPDVNGMYIAAGDNGLSFRNYDNLLLMGGGGHRTGKCGGGYDKLTAKAAKLFPHSKICDSWATEDCMTLDGIPYIGRYSPTSTGLLTATGFNKWGMTSSMVAAKVLSDMITNEQSDYADLFSPKRFGVNKQLFINLGTAVAGLVNFKTKRCSHMGCALNFNRPEHTWDCPCHGSRFDKKGHVINNPAKKDIRLNK